MIDVTIPFKNILVPTDGSQSSIRAGRLAIQLAALHKAHIMFVYVVDQSIAMELASVSGKELHQAQTELEQSAQRYLDYLTHLASEMDVVSSQLILHGIPYNEIETLAREQNVDLITIGLIGSRGSRSILVGSITERIVEQSPCPVLVAK